MQGSLPNASITTRSAAVGVRPLRPLLDALARVCRFVATGAGFSCFIRSEALTARFTAFSFCSAFHSGELRRSICLAINLPRNHSAVAGLLLLILPLPIFWICQFGCVSLALALLRSCLFFLCFLIIRGFHDLTKSKIFFRLLITSDNQ